MKKRAAKPAKKRIDYPEETDGSRLAAEIRRRCNKLTKEQRRKHFAQAMQVYYGSTWPKESSPSFTGQGLDKGEASKDLRAGMKKRLPASAKRKIDFPEHTEYDRMAAEVRRRANRLTPEERVEYLRRGMVRVYGGEWPKEATGAGH